MIRIKRTYDPRVRSDGRRILVERLWPRGMKKEALAADAWMKEVAPSTQLRKWILRARRKELAAVSHRFQVKQHRMRSGIAAEIIEQVRRIDVRCIAERDSVCEADAPRCGPIERGGEQGARLRQEGKRAGRCRRRGKAGVQTLRWGEQTHAIRAEHSHEMRLCSR